MSEPIQHHTHKPSDVLPGATPTAPESVDYSVPAVERMPSKEWKETPSQWQDAPSQGLSSEENAPTTESDRPLDVKPAEGGGVSIGGHSDLPEGKAGLKDKIIGKTEKVIGKMTGNEERHERGELRESGGKAAAMGQAKAPHD